MTSFRIGTAARAVAVFSAFGMVSGLASLHAIHIGTSLICLLVALGVARRHPFAVGDAIRGHNAWNKELKADISSHPVVRFQAFATELMVAIVVFAVGVVLLSGLAEVLAASAQVVEGTGFGPLVGGSVLALLVGLFFAIVDAYKLLVTWALTYTPSR